MRNFSKKLLSVFVLTVLMLLTLLPVTALATADVGDETALRNAVESGSETNVVLSGDISLNTQLAIHHNLTIDLAGKSLTIILDDATGKSSNGIKIADGVTLTIRDSSPGSNKLTVTNGATAGTTPGNGAAINVTDGALIIESGTVIANGGEFGAGIGGGRDGAGGNIEIRDGNVTAKGGIGAAGIGGGNFGAGGTIVISGGTVNATGGNGESDCGAGAGIGGGGGYYDGSAYNGDSPASGNITISGTADVTATGGDGADYGANSGHTGAGIGTGGAANNGASGSLGTIEIAATATVTATGGTGTGDARAGANIGTGGGVAGLGTNYYTIPVTNAEELAAALTKVQEGCIIKMLANISYTNKITLNSKIAVLDLNGFELTVAPASGNAIEMNDGFFRIMSLSGGGICEINGNIVANNTSADIIHSNVFACGVFTYGGATITVNGDISVTATSEGSNACGVFTYGGATITVNGDISVTATSEGSQVSEALGVGAIGSATVTVNGNVSAIASDTGAYASAHGVDAYGDATVTVNGNVSAIASGTGDYAKARGVNADGGANVTVSGNVTAEATGENDDVYGVLAQNGANVTVNGNVTAEATGEDGDVYGVSAQNGANVTVNGNVTAEATSEDGIAFGVSATLGSSTGAKVTVDGTITVSGATTRYIVFEGRVEMPKDPLPSLSGDPGKEDYFEYTDNTNTVWVRDPDTWVAPTVEGPSGAARPVGYDAFIEEFAIGGTPTSAVTKESGNAAITLVGRNTLQIAAGLPAGTYPVVLKAKNVAGTATFTFTFTVTGGGGLAPINYDKHEAYLDGYPDGTVRPDEYITRAEAAALFFRAAEDDGKNTPITSSLTDIASGEWYYQAVAYMEKTGVITGYPDGTFRPNALITRAEFAAITARFAGLADNASGAFPDVPDSYWAAKYINGAAAKDYVTGYPDGTFKPDNFVTRAEAIVIINRVLNRKIALSDIPAGANKFSDIDSGHWAYAAIVEASVTHEFTRRPDGSEIWR